MRLREVLDYGVELARGLAAAHDAGIVHRDLKPDNIWLTKDGRLKILDFGLAKLDPAKAASADGETVTVQPQSHPGHVVGTVGYMSPEQVRGQTADARSDIFAVGVILYEMLTGKPAFRKATSAETMTAILNEDPAGTFAACVEYSTGIAKDRESLPREEPGQALSARFGSGVRTGISLRFERFHRRRRTRSRAQQQMALARSGGSRGWLLPPLSYCGGVNHQGSRS